MDDTDSDDAQLRSAVEKLSNLLSSLADTISKSKSKTASSKKRSSKRLAVGTGGEGVGAGEEGVVEEEEEEEEEEGEEEEEEREEAELLEALGVDSDDLDAGSVRVMDVADLPDDVRDALMGMFDGVGEGNDEPAKLIMMDTLDEDVLSQLLFEDDDEDDDDKDDDLDEGDGDDEGGRDSQQHSFTRRSSDGRIGDASHQHDDEDRIAELSKLLSSSDVKVKTFEVKMSMEDLLKGFEEGEEGDENAEDVLKRVFRNSVMKDGPVGVQRLFADTVSDDGSLEDWLRELEEESDGDTQGDAEVDSE